MSVNVTLELRGLVVLSAKKGDKQGKVGILKTFPLGHDLTITVTKTPPDPNPIVLPRRLIRPDLSLEIEPVTEMTIRDEREVNRNAPVQHPQSFRWFVDLENGELHDDKIDVEAREFSSILTFLSGGELYTAETPNDSILQIVRPRSIDFEDFGRVALALGVDFKSVTKAVLRNGIGTDPVFDSSTESKTDYLIKIDHDASIHPPISMDANFYYRAVGRRLSLNERFFFMSSSLDLLAKNILLISKFDEERLRGDTNSEKVLEDLLSRFRRKPLAGPEAACFPAYVSRSTFEGNA